MISAVKNIMKNLGIKTASLKTDIEDGQHYKVIFPCSNEASREANKLAKKAFGKENYISQEIIDEWRAKNEKLLTVIVDAKFNCRGYFDLIPLEEAFYNQLAKGEKKESDIRADVIMAGNEFPTHLYIGGVTSNDDNPIIGSLLLTSLLLKLHYLYNKRAVVIGALAATKDGEHYLKEFGFEEGLISKGLRNDGMAFFQREVTKADVNGYLDEWGRRSKYLDYSAYRWYAVK